MVSSAVVSTATLIGAIVSIAMASDVMVSGSFYWVGGIVSGSCGEWLLW